MKQIIQKFRSRKLWACLIGVLIGIGTMLGMDEGTVGTVSGAAASLISVVTYMITEGRIDAAAVSTAAKKAEDAVQVLREEN